jgi:hypothetical protein
MGKKQVTFPRIDKWLKYCDRHRDRAGDNLSSYIDSFSHEGYTRINQLTGDRVSVKDLSDWLSLGKGTVDLLMRYAEQDVEAINQGEFDMSLLDSPEEW